MSELISLETPRLRIRRLTPDDFDFFYAMQSNPVVMRYIRPPEPDPDAVRERMAMLLQYAAENPGMGSMIGTWKTSGQPVATCVLRHLEFQPGNDLELGYLIEPSHWGLGLATEVAECLARHAFEHFGVDKVLAVVDPENLPSQKVLLKCGFRQIGRRAIYGSENLEFKLERH